MSNKCILISRPKHDLINTYFFYWSQKVVDEARKHNIKVLDLSDKKATRKNITSYINTHNPNFIFMNGHGDKNRIAGHDNEILIESNENDILLENKIVYVRSCEVGVGLGVLVADKKTGAFIGYTKKYNLITLRSCQYYPMKDHVAVLFLEPSNLIPISLLKGNMVKDAYRKSQNAMINNLRFMLSTKASSEQKSAVPYLWANKKAQIVLGNADARI